MPDGRIRWRSPHGLVNDDEPQARGDVAGAVTDASIHAGTYSDAGPIPF